jgi:hypothetical protein
MTKGWKEQEGGLYVPLIVVGILLAGWTLFWYGWLWQYIIRKGMQYSDRALIAALSPVALMILSGIFWFRRDSWCPLLSKELENHTDAIDAMPDLHIGLWIALAAGLSLFTELMIIRLHASYFQLFAYFKNVSLLSCFLGLGIGYARGSRRPLATPLVLPLLTVQILLIHSLRQFFPWVAGFLQNPISEQLAMGMPQARNISHIVTVYGFLSMIFAFNALCFMPLGHLASRLMMRRQKLISYSWNLVGSLLGILVFYFLSFLWAPPSVWILFATLMLVVFLRGHIKSLLASTLAAVVLLAFLSFPFRPSQEEGSVQAFDVYSPYQILTLEVGRDSPPTLRVSNVYYQRIVDLSEDNLDHDEHLKKWVEHYSLPYSFKPEPEDVLIVGSGTGNDVAAAIQHGAGQIDAVEIDPAILQFGKWLHPQSPYQANNVNAVVDDARAFIRYTDRQYDLIVYGLLDSHTLLSGQSSVRLDSFVYTVEAFREARARLKDGGIMSITFFLIRPELGRKLFLMLQEAFDGQSPLVYLTSSSNAYTFLIGDGLARQSLHQSPGREATVVFANSEIQADKSTDDWPFFYMPVRKYPLSYAVMILVLLAISLVFVHQLVPRSGSGFSVSCFFLGAGFMLVETKGITELALVYGSTWIVVGVVIAAILIMGFLANLLVSRIGSHRPLITYGLLFASLIAGLYLSSANLSTFAPWLSRTIMTMILTLPLFFSGFAFSAELRKSASVAVALSSNLLGAMLGGFLEYNSMYFGFRSLYFVALAMYGFAFFGSIRARK